MADVELSNGAPKQEVRVSESGTNETDKTDGNDGISINPPPQKLDSSSVDPSSPPNTQPTAKLPSSSQPINEIEQVTQSPVSSQEPNQGVQTSPDADVVPSPVRTPRPLPPIPQTEPINSQSSAPPPTTQADSTAQSTNLPSNIETSILDATQSSINSSTDRKPPNPASERAKKNFANAFTAVRGFLAKGVEKINQKLEEMDEEMLKAMEEEELLKQVENGGQTQNGGTGGEVKDEGVENVEGVVGQENLVKGVVNEADDYEKKRKELLGTSTPDNQDNVKYATVPSAKSSSRASQQNSTRSVIADTADALNERGEKLGQLNDKFANMADNSNSFAQLAKELAAKEANKKWYQLF